MKVEGRKHFFQELRTVKGKKIDVEDRWRLASIGATNYTAQLLRIDRSSRFEKMLLYRRECIGADQL